MNCSWGIFFCLGIAQVLFQKVSLSFKSRIWDIGCIQGNVDAKKLDLGHERKRLCVISRDLVKNVPETLLATTIGIFPHFGVLPNFFKQGWEDLVLDVVGGQVTNLAGGVGGRWKQERRIRHA